MPKRRIFAAVAAITLAAAMSVFMSISPASAAGCAAAWNASTAYTGGTQVSYGGHNYTAKWWSQGERPDLNAGTGGDQEWTDNGSCTGGTTPPPAPGPSNPPPGGGGGSAPAWAEGNTYQVGTIVSYNGSCYQALVTHTAYPGTNWNPAATPTLWKLTGSCSGGTTPPPPPPGPSNPPPPAPGGFVVTEAQFNQMFPSRNPFYTYAGLVDAAGKFGTFAKTGSDTIRRQEAAAFLGNVNHETGGLVYITEINKSNDLCDESQSYGCPAGTYGYYGRGPIQLSWNFNYKAAGDYLGQPLLNNPYLVEQNASISWQTALWYWTTQNGPGTMTAHDAMVNQRGFGETIRSINGSLECNGRNPAQVQSRVDAYTRFAGILGVSPGSNLSC